MLQQVHVPFMLGTPQQDTALQVRFHESRAETESPPSPSCPRWFGWGQLSGLSAHSQVMLSFSSPTASSSSLQGCSQSIICSICICTWDCPNPGTASYIWPCWLSYTYYNIFACPSILSLCCNLVAPRSPHFKSTDERNNSREDRVCDMPTGILQDVPVEFIPKLL